MTPPSIVVGDAKAGETYFQKTCTSCHSVTGDLKGVGTKYGDAKNMQNSWLTEPREWAAAVDAAAGLPRR